MGALVSGLLTFAYPEARGGGGDAMIDAFHHADGFLAPRLLWVKALASIATLGSGGAGGREGPTMFIGGALGVWVGDLLRVGARERRLLLVAGVAAGISAVFRTPLGAALLAVEVLYRDDFESDALVPVGPRERRLVLGRHLHLRREHAVRRTLPRFPFVPAHLPLYALLALAASRCWPRAVRRQCCARVQQLHRAAAGARVGCGPRIGGLALGVFCDAGHHVRRASASASRARGSGILGGGYGAAQVAISGATWLPAGWRGVELLLLLLRSPRSSPASLTIGSGGSAGDFAPSLAIGGLFGGAFGRAAQLLLHDPRIDPGAFALVGMGAFYGGIAHVPLSALVLVCEMAGSYDLLVPLMLAEGIAFVALRQRVALPGAGRRPSATRRPTATPSCTKCSRDARLGPDEPPHQATSS